MADEYAYDVFISYSSKDQTWVRGELLQRLEQAGLKVCIDFRDFELGEPSVSAMERAVRTSRKTLLVLTPAYLSSAWTEFENLMLQWLDPANRQRRLIPLVREQCEWPSRIGYLIHIDFITPDDRSWRRLLDALGAPDSPAVDVLPPTPADGRLRPLLPPSAVYLIGLVLSLLSTVVFGFLMPSFEQQRWLALLLFLMACALGLWLTLSQAGAQTHFFARWKLSQQLPAAWRWALIGLVLPLAVGVWFLIPVVDNVVAQRAPQCLPDRVCVLVANIAPEGSTVAAEVTRDLTQQIQAVLDQVAQSRYTVRTGVSVSDATAAVEQAKKDGATLAVWGEVFENIKKLRIQFSLVDLLSVSESPTVRVYRAEPLHYDLIDRSVECNNCVYGTIATTATQHIQMVSYTVAGLVDYVQGRPEQAKSAFVAALYYAGEPNDVTRTASIQPACTLPQPSSDWKPGLLYYYLGKSLVLQGDYQQGIEHLQKAATLNPCDPAAWIGIGTAYQSWLARPTAPEAVEAYHQAEAKARASLQVLPPTRWGAIYYDLGLIQELQSNPTAAAQHYTEAAARFGIDNVSAYTTLVSLGRVQFEAGDVITATQTLAQASQLFPRSLWAYLELARLAHNDRAQAEMMLEQAAQWPSQDAAVEITRAELCASVWQDRTCAAEAYEQALARRPNSGWLHSRVGVFYLPANPVQRGQSWELAREHFAAAATLRPNDPWAHERLAYVLHNLGDYTGAAEQYQRAIDLAYSETAAAGFYCNLGRAQQLGDWKVEAEQNYQRCADLAATPELRERAEQLLEALKQ